MKQDTVDPAVRDGRSSRWDRHRARRRRELVRAAREAVHELGPGVSMEEIAAHAGTSKSVFYRYFGDRAGLRRAVAERVTERVEQRLREAADSSPDGPSALHRMVAECLAVASSSPAVYAFAITEAEPDADGAPVLGPFFERVSHVLADGLARANHRPGHDARHVVAVIGDGAMTGGMAWEALDNIADSSDRHLVIVVNDNGRSYAPTIGGLAHHLDALRTNPGYERVLSGVKRTLLSQGAPGRAAFDALHGLKRGLKDVLVPSAFFEDLGIKYTGPVDGHDITAIEFALTRAREYAEPVIVHVITEKGHGYTPAEEHVPDRFHAVGKIHPETGLPVVAERFGWTAVFAEEIVSLAQRDERIVGVTAAMQAPVGLQPLADAMPERVIDVGIAEQHALTFSAGLAFAGMHPVVALYATFLNRAFDQVLMDVALHRAGVTIVLDRAGITGTDGASHNGMWDMALLAHVPGLRLAAPRDEATLRDSLRQAVSVGDAPTVVRYPKGTLPEPLAAVRRLGLADAEKSPYDAGVEGDASSSEALGEVSAFDVVDVLLENREPADAPQLLLVGVGAMAAHAHEAGRALEQEDRAVTVVHPHWVIPPPGPLVAAAAQADVVIVVEDGLVDGGIGSQLRDAVEDYWAGRSDAAGPRVWRRIGIPRQFIDTATRDQLLEDFGMRAPDIAEAARAAADGAARAPGVRDLGAE